MKLNHLGYAAKNLEETVNGFLKLGYVKGYVSIKHHVPKNMYVQRVVLGDLKIEVMQTADLSKPSFISDALDATTEPCVLHHICYDVEDMHKTVDELMATGEYTIHEAITDGVFNDCLLCFLRHKAIGLVELFEWPETI